MSNIVKVQCPQCKRLLSFMDAPDIGNKLIVCPKCNFRATVDVYRSGPAGTGGQGETEATEPPQYISKDAMITGCLRLTKTGKIFPLKPGKNVIGRIAQSGTADIQLNDDEYMSRRHIEIDIVETALGLEHRLVEINSKNEVLLNNKPLPRGDILVLQFGDKMILGKTEVVLERPEDGEETRKLGIRN